MRVGERTAQRKDQILREGLVVVDRDVDAPVVDLADIGPGRDVRHAERRGKRRALHEDARTLLLEPVEDDVQAVEQADLHAHVEFAALLPRSVGIAVDRQNGPVFPNMVRADVDVVPLIHIDGGQIGEAVGILRRDDVVADQTVRNAEFQQIHLILDGAPEGFVRNDPPCGHRGEEAEALARREVLRAVVAEIGLHQIALVESVGDAAGQTLLAIGQHGVLLRVGDVHHALLLVVDQRGAHVVFLVKGAVIVQLHLKGQLAVAVLAARGAQIGRARVGRFAHVAVIARIVDAVIGQLVQERRERAVDGRIDAVVEGRHSRRAQALGDEPEILIHGQRRGEMAAELVAVPAAQLGIGIGEQTAVPGVGHAEAREGVGRFAGQRGREFAGHGRQRILEEVGDVLDRRMAVVQLGVHFQRHARRRRGVGRDVGLEEVLLRVDVRVVFRNIGLADDAVLVIGRGVEEIVELLGTARHVEVEILVERSVLEEHVVPVDVGIDIRIEPQPRTHDLLVAVTRRTSARETGLVVGLHEGDAVGDFGHARRR